MNVLKFEFKQSLKGQIGWVVASLITLFLFLGLFNAYMSAKEAVVMILQGFPAEVLSAFSLDLEIFFSIEGYFLFALPFLYLVAGLQSANLSIQLFSKENRCKTNDFLFTKPMNRSTIFMAKVSVLLVFIVMSQVIMFIPTYLLMKTFDPDLSINYVLICSLTILLIQFFFASLGTFVGTILRRLKSVSIVAMLCVFSFYIISLLESVVDNSILQLITPFCFFNQELLFTNQQLDLAMIVYCVVICLVLMGMTHTLYIKQDIHAV